MEGTIQGVEYASIMLHNQMYTDMVTGVHIGQLGESNALCVTLTFHQLLICSIAECFSRYIQVTVLCVCVTGSGICRLSHEVYEFASGKHTEADPEGLGCKDYWARLFSFLLALRDAVLFPFSPHAHVDAKVPIPVVLCLPL